ncbi:hypothetical protein APHAL10511_007040 [Amanita phalloides]|nr:hypothetical protein APHAL10511_007040 [Amanita phalloides]
MGNSASSSGRSHQDETVDFGYLTPQGVYTGPPDWNHPIVSQLVCQRKLAPFYRPLEDYDDSWDDDQILAARKSLSDAEGESVTRTESLSTSGSTKSTHNKRPGALKEPSKPEAAVYRGAVECPICFLYYPPNINHSRCCDQAICTECFVQIKRNEPTTTHLVSEPAACPYCVQENFGVVYTPPPWRAGMGNEGPPPDVPKGTTQTQQFLDNSLQYPTHKRRQKSYSADSPEVVTTDQIRPDWETKLAAVRAAVARRANRRIVMRQVGDRLIPVGVTSGRVHALGPEDGSADNNETGGGSRRRRRAHGQGFEQFLGMSGQDLEELMVMEAMRLSLLDHEEQQRKEAAERKKSEAMAAAESRFEDPPNAGPSTMEAHSRTNPQAIEPPVNSDLWPPSNSQGTDNNTSTSTGSTALHLSGPCHLSSTSSTTGDNVRNEASNSSLVLNGLSNGDQTPNHSHPITPSSENGTLSSEPRTIDVPTPVSSSILLSVPTDRPTFPSTPDSPSASESLLNSNAQMFRKVRRSVENRQDLLR